MSESFGKAYKLCSKKKQQFLFEDKTTVKAYPFLLHFRLMELDANSPFQVVVSAPKRVFRRAHDRNYAKRVMRELLRKNKTPLEDVLSENKQQVALFLLRTSSEDIPFEILERKFNALLDKLIQELKTKL